MIVDRRSILVSTFAAAIARPAIARPRSHGGIISSSPSIPNPALVASSGGNYPDPQSAWNAWATVYSSTPWPYNSSNPIPQVFQCDNETFTLPNGLDFGITKPANTSLWNGSGLPAVIFTTTAGANFNPNVRSNPLRYNTANGTAWNITCSGNCNRPNSTNQGISIGTANIAINNIQIQIAGPTNVGLNCENGGPFYMNYCILEANVSGNPGGSALVTAGSTFTACLFVNFFPFNGTAPNGIITDDGGSAFIRCTVVVPNDLSTAQLQDIANEFAEASPKTTITDSVFMGATNFSGGGSAYISTNCATDATVTGYTPPLSGIVQVTPYSSQFQNVTTASGDWRLQSSSALIAAGSTVGTGQYDITGSPIPSSSACDIGCYQFTPAPIAVTVNGASSGVTVVAGDPIHIQVTGVPSSPGINIAFTDTSFSLGSAFHTIRDPSPTSTVDAQVLTTISGTPASGGSYGVAIFYIGDPTTVHASATFTITTVGSSPVFGPPLTNATLDQFNCDVVALGSGGAILAGNTAAQAVMVRGTVVFGIDSWNNLESMPHPTNVTMQYQLHGDSGPGNLVPTTYTIGGQVTDAGGFPSVSFNTATIPDGTYMLTGLVVDCADTAASPPWAAYQLIPYPKSVIINNGGTPQSPTGTWLIPTASLSVNTEVNSTAIDFVVYDGLPQQNRASPYPPTGSPPTVPEVYLYPAATLNPSSPFSPATNARTANYYCENSGLLNIHEYRRTPKFYTTTAGGIFVGSWSGEGGDETVEATYPAMARQAWVDGPRNSHMSTGNSIGVATVDPRRTGTGPFDSYHWTIINIGGSLSVRDLAGNMLCIGGYKADTTQLPQDYLDSNVEEFPNTVLVGQIDAATGSATSGKTFFSDFGGGPNDCCWDPNNPNICYVAQTLDHCIVALDFTVTGPYGHSNPRMYRFAGYKGGLNGTGAVGGNTGGGYQDGPALGTFTGTFTGAISGTTLTVSSLTGTITAGQSLTDGGAGNLAYNTVVVSGSGSGPFVISPSQTVSAETMYANNGDGALFNGIFSICMQKVSGISGHPVGTMYVADYYNCLIRKIAYSGTPGVAGAVTTITGLAGGSSAPGANPSFNTTVPSVNTYSCTITSVGGGNAAVVIASTPSTTVAVGWYVTIRVSGSVYTGGGSTTNNGSGIYTVSAFTDSQHFNITMGTVPSPGSITIDIFVADFYSSPSTIGFASAYSAYPQTIRTTSNGDLIFAEAWYNMMLRRMSWSTSQITRIMPFGNLAQIGNTSTALGGYGFFDVDDVGACGPIDDIVCFKTDANPGSAGYTSRIAIDASYEGGFVGSDGLRAFPQEGTGGTGHYPWLFIWSKTQCRWLAAGKADTEFYSGRPQLSSDPPTQPGASGQNLPIEFDSTTMPQGYSAYLSGTCSRQWEVYVDGLGLAMPLFPFLFRPSFAALGGQEGTGFLGQNIVPSIDDLLSLYPTDFNPSGSQTGYLSGFIQAGMGGMTPRPEFSMDGSAPGRLLAQMIYFFRRQAITGSGVGTGTVVTPLTLYGDGGGSGVVNTATYSMDCVRPMITSVSPTHSGTTLTVTWTTDKPCLSIVGAGTANSVGKSWPYNLWGFESTFGTSHSVTVSNLPSGATPIHYAILSLGLSGIYGQTADATVT